MTEDSLTDTEVLELLRGTHLAVFTVVSADGFAHSTPVWYLPEPAGSVTILIDPESVKARILRRDPRATALIVNNSDGSDRWVMYRGKAEVIRRSYRRPDDPHLQAIHGRYRRRQVRGKLRQAAAVRSRIAAKSPADELEIPVRRVTPNPCRHVPSIPTDSHQSAGSLPPYGSAVAVTMSESPTGAAMPLEPPRSRVS